MKGLSYVSLGDHAVGLVSNSAGLSMATMDMLYMHGAKCANFLDLGGQVYHEKIMNALVLM